MYMTLALDLSIYSKQMTISENSTAK